MNVVLEEIKLKTGQWIQIVEGDITEDSVDAIVNAANAHLQHGAGVAGAISRKGGAVIQSESKSWVEQYGPVSHELPAWTSAGSLNASYIIHAVGPVWGEGDEVEKLRSAIIGTLRRADELECKTLAIPAISTGIFGFPKDRAAKVILKTVHDYLSESTNSELNRIRLTMIDPETISVFMDALDELMKFADE
jgi:O-acetyl-ADP-ribose deacetylase (regulator of RNase III)